MIYCRRVTFGKTNYKITYRYSIFHDSTGGCRAGPSGVGGPGPQTQTLN